MPSPTAIAHASEIITETQSVEILFSPNRKGEYVVIGYGDRRLCAKARRLMAIALAEAERRGAALALAPVLSEIAIIERNVADARTDDSDAGLLSSVTIRLRERILGNPAAPLKLVIAPEQVWRHGDRRIHVRGMSAAEVTAEFWTGASSFTLVMSRVDFEKNALAQDWTLEGRG